MSSDSRCAKAAAFFIGYVESALAAAHASSRVVDGVEREANSLRAAIAAVHHKARADSAVPSSHPSALSDRESGECVRAPDGEIERGWLIERKAGPFGMKNYPARWWKGGVEPLTGEDCWTADANNACRFCRAVDASAALIALSWRDGARTGAQRAKLIKRVTITEHLWCDAAVHQKASEPNAPKHSTSIEGGAKP